MRVTALRACTAIGARATARAGGRRARGTAVGMMSHGAVREGASPSGGAVDGAHGRVLGRAERAMLVCVTILVN